MCSTNDHPKCIALAANIPQCLQNRSSFLRKAEELSTSPIFNTHKTLFIFHLHHGRVAPSHEGQIATTVPGITIRADDTSQKRRCSLTTIASYQANYIIYTDGSASRGTRNEGAVAFVSRGSLLQSVVVTIIKSKGRTFTSSYEQEAAAMESALSRTSTNGNYPSISILICTDSKSWCQALISSNPRIFSIHNFIKSISFSIFIQWIPGHSAISSNNLANTAISLRQYLNWLNPSQDPICPNSRLEVQDLLHWLCKFPALMIVRQRVFRNHQGSVEWLATQPGDVVSYARKALVNLDA